MHQNASRLKTRIKKAKDEAKIAAALVEDEAAIKAKAARTKAKAKAAAVDKQRAIALHNVTTAAAIITAGTARLKNSTKQTSPTPSPPMDILYAADARRRGPWCAQFRQE